jgi:hypothetical protein
MKRIALFVATASFAFWFNVNPEMLKFLPTDSNGNLKEYTRDTVNRDGEDVTLRFGGLAQSGLKSVVDSMPKPTF